MSSKCFDVEGVIISPESLHFSRSRDLAVALATSRLTFVVLVECRCRSYGEGDIREIVVFDVEVERPQRCVHEIQRIERIAVEFTKADDWFPEVTSLREDFPQVPHVNLRDSEFPRSLCLYDQPWSEIALRWTPTTFVERIRSWLAETAKGTLHQEDQPLEPVLAGTGLSIILPPDLFSSWKNQEAKQLQVRMATIEESCRVLTAHTDPNASGLSVVAICLMAKPRQHAAIRRRPRTLAELHALLENAGIDLRETLLGQLEAVESKHRWDRRLLLIIAFPLLRKTGQNVEITDVWAFLSLSTIAEVGISIGLWMKVPGSKQLGALVGATSNAVGEDIKIDVIAPQFGVSRESAAIASNLSADPCHLIAIGAGALGSQVVRLLAQSGFGSWTIVDDDILAPHNTVRHTLTPMWTGWSKATALANELSELYPSETPPLAIADDFVCASASNEQLKKAIEGAELLLDLSASIPVARQVARNIECNARRASLFLNPSGSDLVMLIEDRARTITLDCLEMQYYREIAYNDCLSLHLLPPTGRIRYARSCRDISSTIPTSLVALHAAIGSDEIRKAHQGDHAQAVVWHASGSPIQVHSTNIAIHPMHRETIGGWTLIISSHVVHRLSELRASKLPNETGGVLIGGYDLPRKTIYVVDMLSSPADSEEWPTLYIRGNKGLAKSVERISDVTNGQLEYVGEWHSHPDGCPCLPSEDDLKVFGWLVENMSDAGLPSLMGIAGDGRVAWYVGEMHCHGGWETLHERK